MSDMPRTALAALIDSTRDRNDWSDGDIVRHAQSRGLKLTASDISLYRQQGMKTLVPAKVKALAIGLRLPPHRVAVEVLRDLGIDVPLDVRSPEDAVTHDDTLKASTRDHLLLLIAADRSN